MTVFMLCYRRLDGFPRKFYDKHTHFLHYANIRQDALEKIELDDQKRLGDETVSLALLKRYTIQRQNIVQFLRVFTENKNRMSQGTTGLDVWESAMVLAKLALNRKVLLACKNEVELGAGIGFSGICTAQLMAIIQF